MSVINWLIKGILLNQSTLCIPGVFHATSPFCYPEGVCGSYLALKLICLTTVTKDTQYHSITVVEGFG